MELHELQKEICGLQSNVIAIRSEKDKQKQLQRLNELMEKLFQLTNETGRIFTRLNDTHKLIRNPKLQLLHKAMLRHEHMTGEDFQKTKAELLARYKITSRSQLTDAQLETEIQYFISF